MMRANIPAEEIVSKARAIGQYYGFHPLADLTAKSRGAQKVKAPDVEPTDGLSLDPVAEVVASFLRQCRTQAVVPDSKRPLFIWHTNAAYGRSAPKKVSVQFHAIGVDRALAEALVIRAMQTLVRDLYRTEPVIRLNSMGDKETRARYAKELTNFFKKRSASLPDECVQSAKQDTLLAAELAIARACAEELPAPLEHLSDASRKRFEDLLEYLELTETPYELSKNLLSRGGVWSDTCFEILAHHERVAWGSRYTDLAKRFFPSASFSAFGGVLTFASGGEPLKKPSVPKSRFVFVHIGDEAKRHSMRLAEEFRKARVPLVQHIGVESLTEQMHLAEAVNTPYLLIMGRREALENSAILRNRQTQQETILPLTGLAERLKTFS